jgi:hypothetical protein
MGRQEVKVVTFALNGDVDSRLKRGLIAGRQQEI